MQFLVLQLLNALQYAMLLFLLSVGLTIIFGLLQFINLAHGALYAVGAYFGVSVAQYVGNFWVALIAVPFGVMCVGALLYFLFIQRLRDAGPLHQVLVTFGLVFVFLDIIRLGWGDVALSLDVPSSLQGTTVLGSVRYPSYRLFIIGLGLAIMLALWLVFDRTSIGARIRASVENDHMAMALGIHVERLFFWVFCLGCALAGLAGVVAAPVLSASTDMSIAILIPTLMVVVIGGLGSLKGAIIGSTIVAFIETFGAVVLTDFAAIGNYVLLAAVLLLRPKGLIPAK